MTNLVDVSALPQLGTIADADIVPMVDLTQPAGSRTRRTTAGAFAAYVAAKYPPSTGGGGGGGSTLPSIVFDVRANGANGIGPTFDDAPSIQSAINAAGVLGGAVYFPRAAVAWTCGSGLNLTGLSFVTLFGDPGYVSIIKATAALNGSNNADKNDLIYALNFTGSATSTGYAQSNIVIQDLTLDCTLMSASGVPAWNPMAGGSYGRSLAAFENLNVDYCTCRRLRVLGAFGNGLVHGTSDPRLFNDAGQNNGLRNPIMEDIVFIGCVRGVLPQYGSVDRPLGITGDCMQIGSCLGGRISRIYVLNPGGPAIDIFNVSGLTIEDVYVEGFGVTPSGAKTTTGTPVQQIIGGIHSDFGCVNVSFRRITFNGSGGFLLGGNMSNVNPFNGNTRTPGPQYCKFEDIDMYRPMGKLQIAAPTFVASGNTYSQTLYATIPTLVQFLDLGTGLSYQYRRGTDGTFGSVKNSFTGYGFGTGQTLILWPGDAIAISYTTAPVWTWYLTPNIGFPGIQLLGGSLMGYVGQALGNKFKKVSIREPGQDAIQIYDGTRNVFEDVYVENVGANASASAPCSAVAMLTQINQAGGGTYDNKLDNFQIYDDRSPQSTQYNFRDDSSLCVNNRYMNSRLEAYTLASMNLNTPASNTASGNYGPGYP